MSEAVSTLEKESFENSPLYPRHDGSQVFLRGEWERWRDSGIAPLHASRYSDDEAARGEFVAGAKLLGLGRKRMPKLEPQMLVLADVANACPRFMGVLLPRRSSKTTSLFALAMGRISERPGYLVSYTMATTAIKARARFKRDIVAPLEEQWRHLDKKDWPFKINNAGGSESITWFHEGDSDSVLQFLAPKGEGFRSDAWDLIIIDEGGEASPAMTADLIEGALATMDTRPDATLIVAGTAGKIRDGNLLWQQLEDGRKGQNSTGITEYAAPDTTKRSDVDTWEKCKPILLKAHPGIGTLTTLETMESNYEKMCRLPDGLSKFMAEYLSIFAVVGGSSFIDTGAWAERAKEIKPTPPANFRFAYAVHPLQTSASIVAAWRVAGVAHGLVLDHREGVSWVAKRNLEISRKHRVPIAFDSLENVNAAISSALGRAKPKPKLEPYNWNQVSTAAATLFNDIESGNVVHYDQDSLNDAVRLAHKRGTRESKRWAFGRGPGEANEPNDITSLEAWSIALKAYDEAKPRVPVEIIY